MNRREFLGTAGLTVVAPSLPKAEPDKRVLSLTWDSCKPYRVGQLCMLRNSTFGYSFISGLGRSTGKTRCLKCIAEGVGHGVE